MIEKIYKYQLSLSPGIIQEFDVPIGARILTVQMNNRNPVM